MAEAGAQFSAFGLVQFLAAVHIFITHLWQQMNYLDPWMTRHWGVSWVACFFVLSGFKLTYSQLRRKDRSKLDPFVPYLWRRVLRLIPLYYLSLFITFLSTWWRGERVPTWVVLPFNLTLTFTWFGSRAGGWHAGWHGAHWYMCDLIFHQICWRFVYPRVLRLSVPMCWCTLLVSASVTGARLLGIRWHFFEQETIFWAPYTFNQFLCGVCLAKLFVERNVPEGAPGDRLALVVRGRRIPLSGLCAFTLVLLIFQTNPGRPQGWAHNSVWTGILLPFHILMVWCLCLEEGPLDWLCQRWPFDQMGELSYGIYIFHWNAILFCMKYEQDILPMQWSEAARFFLVILPATVLFSALAIQYFDRPIQAWGSRLVRRASAPREAHAKSS